MEISARRILLISILFLVVVSFQTFYAAPVQGSELFSDISITDVSLKGHKLHVKGRSDLPSGALLNVKWHFPGLQAPGKGVKVHLNKHRFFVQVDLPFKKSMKGKTGLLRLIFDPSSGQSGSVLSKVGSSGENLAGSKVRVKNTVRILEDILTVSF